MVRGTNIPLMGLDGDDDALSSLVAAAADEEGCAGTIQPLLSTVRWQIWCGWVILLCYYAVSSQQNYA